MDDRILRPDLKIVEDAIAGKPEALDLLLRAAWPHAFRLAMTVLKDRAHAEDAAQEASAAAAISIQKLRDPSAFAKWFVRITVREAMRLSKLQRNDVAPLSDDQSVSTIPASEVLDMRASILNLPIELRMPLVLSTYCGLSGQEIAEIMNLSAGAVRFRVWRAKSALRAQMSEQLQTAADGSMAYGNR